MDAWGEGHFSSSRLVCLSIYRPGLLLLAYVMKVKRLEALEQTSFNHVPHAEDADRTREEGSEAPTGEVHLLCVTENGPRELLLRVIWVDDPASNLCQFLDIVPMDCRRSSFREAPWRKRKCEGMHTSKQR